MRRAAAMAAILGGLAFTSPAQADDSPARNLGNGLSRLVEPLRAKSGFRLTQAPLAIRDRRRRVLVDAYVREGMSMRAVRERAEAAGLKTVTQVGRHRVLEGYVAIRKVNALAGVAGVASVSLALRPVTHVGAATSQGVAAERADRVPPGIDGSGITVGALSDSFDTATETVDGEPLTVRAADDIRTGDLPPEGVTVLQDGSGADEGRAMLQIIHDIAPGARLCFATATTGDHGFADNIRALADPDGECRADVIVDDVGILDEPFFGEGPISDAVDEVAAQGVHYFSAAGNGSSQQAYQAPLQLVPVAGATSGTNLDLTGVDPALYAGGFQDFDPGPGVDIGQSMVVGGDPTAEDGDGEALFDLQWDDPVDPSGAPLGPPLLQITGHTDAAQPVASITLDGTAGQTIQAVVDAVPSGSVDFVLTLKDPSGNVVQRVDTGTSPETVVQTLPATGTYTFEVSGFEGAVGDFTFEVRPVLGTSRTTTDLNALFFDEDGDFLYASQDLNRLSGKPFEIGGFAGRGGLQMAIAKADTDPGTATQLRYQLYDALEYTEYVQPLAPSIFGHPLARGATAVAAYDPFPPFLPEDYTSVGGDLPILFDSSGNRFLVPDIRRVPQLAATDGGNTTFFSADSKLDPDTQPNFFGTSAAAPHAAAIASLALQAHGGRRSLTPGAMRALLQSSTFAHDLDVDHAGVATQGLTIVANGQQGSERRDTRPEWTTPGAMNAPSFFTVSYAGPDSITSLTLDGAQGDPTGLGAGLVFDPRSFAGYPALGNRPFWRQGFPFTLGVASPGIAPTDVSASFSVPGVGDAKRRQFQRMTLTIAPGKLTAGAFLSFGVDRDEAVTAYGAALAGNSADQLGPGVAFPSGTTAGPGMRFSARTSSGRTIAGTLRNRVGAGWTPIDGYGYLNAQAAVAQPSTTSASSGPSSRRERRETPGSSTR